MIMTVAELRRFIDTEEPDEMLQVRLEALENIVQRYTNNNFREYRVDGVVVYPADIKMGIVNMLKWDMENRDKAGIASETISRHSVTYVDQTSENTLIGYPVSLVGFLKPYRKARFGQGLSV